jgi:hypothetical protein
MDMAQTCAQIPVPRMFFLKKKEKIFSLCSSPFQSSRDGDEHVSAK